MKSLFNELIQIIKQQTPLEINPVDMLINITPMSKEAAYRRLRGEIDFSLDEVIKITRKFNISLDNLAGSIHEEKKFNVQMTDLGGSDNIAEGYYRSLKELVSTMKQLKKNPNPAVSISTNMLLPFSHIYKYETMSKFRLFRWLYTCEDEEKMIKMADMVVPPEIINIENSLSIEMLDLATNYLCLKDLLLIYIREIKYFQKIYLLSDQEVMKIKNEVFCFLDDLERDITNGKNMKGFPFMFYICNLNFDLTYLHFSCDNFEAIATQQLGLGYYLFDDPRITEKMKKWKNTLQQNSTLISICGDKNRFEFFKNQREYVDTLDCISG